MTLRQYTHGAGSLMTQFAGYGPCSEADTQKFCEETGYKPEEDRENPCGSVFCAHGAGFYVPWDEVEQYMHLPALEHVE